MNPDVAVVLPALNEEGSVQQVVQGFTEQGARVVVADNGSEDQTANRARAAGATVVTEPRRGYGAACLAGIQALRDNPPDIVVFADCDGTIDARDLAALVAPIVRGKADLALGRRTDVAPGAFPLKNRLAKHAAAATFLLLNGIRIRDLGPFRALRWSTLVAINLQDDSYGLPVETVAKAARARARIVEVDVAYLNRTAGESKVGTHLAQAIKVGFEMAWVPVRIRFAGGRRTKRRRGAIIVFGRTPELGAVKTRLAKRYGDAQALLLHQAFLRDTLDAARATGATVIFARTMGPDCQESAWADHVIIQRGESFGARFDAALHDAHKLLPKRTPYLVVGVDSPHVGPAPMRDALDGLRRGKAVYGPNDGHGFYALGFCGAPTPVAKVFDHDDERSALNRTLAGAGLHTTKLTTRFDLDEPQDLARLAGDLSTTRHDWVPPRTRRVLANLGI